MWKCEMKDHVIVARVYDNDDNDDHDDNDDDA